ncbi:MAG: glycoside hydrolase family 3 N-terminal domain-containing protein [Bacteroidota bacterium]
MRSHLLLALLVVAGIILANTYPSTSSTIADSAKVQEQLWVDSVYNSLTFDEQLGQLITIRAHSDKGAEHIAEVERQIGQYHVGGLCFFQGTPAEQVRLTNRYQSISKIPLLISMDAEWGLGMRMKKTAISFPRQLTMGAIQDNRIIYDMGKEVANQLGRVGVHVNFAPVIDVNNNPNNPVINTRSFGEDRYNVAVKGYMYMKGMEDHGVMASAKHFPGHGDTDVDSHKDLPVITHSRERLDSIELYPFQVLAEQGVGSMMVAHLSVPALDSRPNRPTSLSRATITNVLRQEMGYDGLVFTDALEMKGVTKHFENGQVAAESIMAGNDIITLPEDIAAAVGTIKEYINDGKIAEAQIERSVKRVLSAKYQLGLTKMPYISPNNLMEDLNNNRALSIKQQLYEGALTLVRNTDNLLPFRSLDSLKVASISLGVQSQTPFQDRLADYMEMPLLQTDKNITAAEVRTLMRDFEDKDVVIVSLHNLSSYNSKGFGITKSERDFIEQLAARKKVVLVNFGSPYALKYFENLQWIINAYEEDPLAQDVTAQAIFGAIPMNGRLPISPSNTLLYNTGLTTNPLFRLAYGYPESVDLNSDTLERIGDLMQEAIKEKATPGGVVLIAKDGKIVYQEAFGHHTYDKGRNTQTTDIFDLASVTKIAAATASVMKLQEEGIISIYQPIGRYLPEVIGTNKADLTLYDIMAHQAGLKPWIPFYEQTLANVARGGSGVSDFYSRRPSSTYATRVTDQLYLRTDFKDEIWQQIFDSPIAGTKEYVYSDLGFYLIDRIIRNQTGQSVADYAAENFYTPLGLETMTYNPWQQFKKEQIVPTEEDRYWRNQTIQGDVHDMGAAMLDGISGHAGLFSDAKDLAVMMQMFTNMGYYGGKQYLNPSTVHTFTTRHSGDTRRGIGFDMKELDNARTLNLSDLASEQTYGHLGFTGTATWTDPAHNLVFVFLSNRTYPNMYNNKLGKMDFRPRVQSVVYNAIEKVEEVAIE